MLNTDVNQRFQWQRLTSDVDYTPGFSGDVWPTTGAGRVQTGSNLGSLDFHSTKTMQRMHSGKHPTSQKQRDREKQRKQTEKDRLQHE